VIKIPAALFFSLLISSFCAFAQDTPATFLKAVEEALNEQNAAKFEALIYTDGMSDADKEMSRKMLPHTLNNPGVDTMELQPLAADFQSVFIARGKRIEPTAMPVGAVKIQYKKMGNSSQSSTIPYTTVNGRFYIIGTKSTDLNWKGPEDKAIGYMIMGAGQDAIKGTVKWNASGVDLEKAISSPSRSFLGQYIDEVTITSDSDETDVTITIMDGGKQIFQSAPLKGKGTQSYKRTP
jgi:hypothetical protein